MSKLLKSCVLVALTLCVIASANATITNADWIFPTTTSPGPVQPIAADVTTDSINNFLGWTAGGTHLNESYVLNPGKTTALEFSYSGNQSSSMNGSIITLSSTISGLTSGSFLTNVQMSYDTKWSNTGAPITQTWAYSLNGGTYVDFLTNTVAGAAWQTDSASMAGLQLQDGDTLALRDTLSGATGNGQSLDFDNLQILSGGVTPVPEPSTITLAFAAALAGRRLVRQKKQPLAR